MNLLKTGQHSKTNLKHVDIYLEGGLAVCFRMLTCFQEVHDALESSGIY